MSRFAHRDYLALAGELAQSASADPLFEAKQRSAISRAYYGVFLPARDKKCRPNAKHHEVFNAYCSGTGNASMSFGSRLQAFYAQRCNADYGDLVNDPDWEAQSAIQEADDLLKLLARIP